MFFFWIRQGKLSFESGKAPDNPVLEYIEALKKKHALRIILVTVVCVI